MNIHEDLGKYVVISKVNYELLMKSYDQYEKKKSYSRKYMREHYPQMKLKKEDSVCREIKEIKLKIRDSSGCPGVNV